MHEVVNQLGGPIWVTWMALDTPGKKQIQTHVLGYRVFEYPNTCIWKSITERMQYLNKCLLTSRITVNIVCS